MAARLRDQPPPCALDFVFRLHLYKSVVDEIQSAYGETQGKYVFPVVHVCTVFFYILNTCVHR